MTDTKAQMTDAKERPLLMQGDMVRATLADIKTQTRRVIKPQPDLISEGYPYRHAPDEPEGYDTERYKRIPCPYGQAGDRLWVRERWRPSARLERFYEIEYPDGTTREADAGWEGPSPSLDGAIYQPRWKPSIHMPRWASRLTLEIVSVRVERVQDITEHDALAEGVDTNGGEDWPLYCFGKLWDRINAKRGFGWAENPWVWVIVYRRLAPCKPPHDKPPHDSPQSTPRASWLDAETRQPRGVGERLQVLYHPGPCE